MFDIVICVGPNDKDIIKDMIQFTKKNIIGYNNIYLISSDIDLKIEGTITIYENTLPITIKNINDKLGINERNGWYLQQLYKLYASHFIPDMLDIYLVIDADTYFLKPTTFIDNDGKYLFNTGNEYNISHYKYHLPVLNHIKNLHNSLVKSINKSVITHHMIFNKKYLNKLFEMVETSHGNGKMFWEIFLECIDKTHNPFFGVSEYELYLTFMLIYFPEKVKFRELKWINNKELLLNNNLDYISMHYFLRNK